MDNSRYQIETRTLFGRWRRVRHVGRHRQPAPLIGLMMGRRMDPRRTRVAEVKI